MPKSYLIFKWVVYSLATMLLVLLQLFVLNYIHVGGIVPFLPPMLVGAAASYEGSRASPVYALVFGLLCDLALTGAGVPAGFFTFVFTLAALFASLLAENLFSPGFLCSLMSVTVCYLVTALGRCAVYLHRGTASPAAVLLIAAKEYLVTLPCLIVVFLLFRQVHRRTTVDY